MNKLKLPHGLHENTKGLVMRFAEALAAKLHKAELKYGYSDGWLNDSWLDECRQKLNDHITKGDPLDVAAYCAFLWHHGSFTAQTDWRLIETAPKDGAWVRLWRPSQIGGNRFPEVIGKYLDDGWYWPDRPYDAWNYPNEASGLIEDGFFFCDSSFTHWRPLTEAPAITQKEHERMTR